MKNIPFKPLSERMLEEPFWLGLITVTVVLILIGICYLLKKHLPDYLEKFISEDPESGKLVEKSLHHQGQMSSNLWQQTSQAPYIISLSQGAITDPAVLVRGSTFATPW